MPDKQPEFAEPRPFAICQHDLDLAICTPLCSHSALEFCASSAIGRLAAPLAFISEIGTLFPIALRRLVAQLKPKFIVDPANLLVIHRPTLTL